MNDLNQDLKEYHEFLASVVKDRPEITKTELYHLFCERFVHARLTFDDSLSIDHHLFGFYSGRAWLRYSGRLPESDDRVEVLGGGRKGRAVHVGVFTFSIEFDDE